MSVTQTVNHAKPSGNFSYHLLLLINLVVPETEGSSPRSQQLATGLYPEPTESTLSPLPYPSDHALHPYKQPAELWFPIF